MSVPAVLSPLFVEVALTFLLLFWSGRERVGAVQRGEVKTRDIALRQPNWPERATQLGNAYQSQLELPVLFYLLTILTLITSRQTIFFVILAWAFVIARLGHALVHGTTNNVPRRFFLFLAGALILLVMWVMFILQIFLGL